MNDCPHCGRKLLSKASVRCNWCGTEIEDPAYQAQAENEREAFFAHQAQHDAQSLANMRAVGADAHPLDVQETLLDYDPRLAAAAATSRQRARQHAEDLLVQRTVAQALIKQQKEDVERTSSLRASGFPQRPVVAQTKPPAIPELPEETPEVSGDRFRHLEL